MNTTTKRIYPINNPRVEELNHYFLVSLSEREGGLKIKNYYK